MGKIINSNSILQLARSKSKEFKLAFDDYSEIEDKPIIEQMLFFCFLNMECLRRSGKLSQQAKKKYEALFESKAQQFAEQVYPAQQLFNQYEKNLLESLREGDYPTSIQLLASMLDFTKMQVFEGRYSSLCEHQLNKYAADDDI